MDENQLRVVLIICGGVAVAALLAWVVSPANMAGFVGDFLMGIVAVLSIFRHVRMLKMGR